MIPFAFPYKNYTYGNVWKGIQKMKWQDWSLKWKLALPIAIITLMLMALSAKQISSINSITTDFSAIYENYIPALDMTLNADRDLYQAQIAERSIAMGAEYSAHFESYQTNIKQVEDRLNQVLEYNVNSDLKSLVKRFLSSLNTWKQHSNTMLNSLKNNKINVNEASQLSMGELSDEFESMREILNKIGENLSESSTTLASEVNETSHKSILILIIVSLVAVAVACTVAVIFPRMVIRNIGVLHDSLLSIVSGKGDLTVRLPRMGQDEIGKMSHTFNRFLKHLQELIKHIRDSSGNVGNASKQLNEIVIKNEKTASEQAKAVELVSTALNEMGSAIQEVSNNTQQVATEAQEADSNAQQSASIFKTTITEINSLAESVEHSAETISKLENEATAIASVLDVIKGIAEQTNLLALNAAIEAARAGEQGRGFAVVADEVRTLASKTQESTENINDMINRLQSGVKNAVSSMSSGKEKASATVDSAGRAQTSLQEVTTYLSAISGHIIQVASAVEEQTAVVEHINQNVQHINELSELSADNATVVANASNELNAESIQFKKQVGSFKV